MKFSSPPSSGSVLCVYCTPSGGDEAATWLSSGAGGGAGAGVTVTTAHVEEELGAGTHDTVLVKGTGDAVARLEYVDGVYLLTCTMRERGSRGERECRGSSAVPSTTHTNSLVLVVLCFRVCSHRELLPQLFRACKPGGKLMYQEAVGGSGQRSADQVWRKGGQSGGGELRLFCLQC